MMPDEKERLLKLFEHESRWCREAEAHNAHGDAVYYDDSAAVAWDITGALCQLFGWRRAAVLFGQLDRHINGRRGAFGWPARDSEIDAMVALQNFNDRAETTFGIVKERLVTMPVWHGNTGRK
jgi:hypothetical protein